MPTVDLSQADRHLYLVHDTTISKHHYFTNSDTNISTEFDVTAGGDLTELMPEFEIKKMAWCNYFLFSKIKTSQLKKKLALNQIKNLASETNISSNISIWLAKLNKTFHTTEFNFSSIFFALNLVSDQIFIKILFS